MFHCNALWDHSLSAVNKGTDLEDPKEKNCLLDMPAF